MESGHGMPLILRLVLRVPMSYYFRFIGIETLRRIYLPWIVVSKTMFLRSDP